MFAKRKTPLKCDHVTPELCSPGRRLRILGQVPFFSDLSTDELREINRFFQEQGFGPDEIVYFEGDPAKKFHVVAEGTLKLMRHTRSGKDVLLDLLGPGEYFGCLSPLPEETYPETAIAHTSVCTLQVGKDVFRGILRDYPEVALRVLEITTERLVGAQEMVRQLSAHTVDERIAFMLLKLAEKFGQPKGKAILIQTPLPRGELANMTGTTTESASRTISQFQKSGLIRTGRQWIAITDREGLQDILNQN